MTAALPIAKAAPLTAAGWRPHLAALAAAAAAILLLFHADVAHLVRVWWEGTTFNHCLLIPPIIGWLVWQRAPELRRLAPAAWPPALLLVAAGAFGWLVGEAGGVALARHTGIVLMLQGSVIACLGRDVARGLAFPLFYALFLIPVGEELVAPMQEVTAHISMALLALADIPAHIEGIFITTPTGYFEVAEACSGVKFLVAMLAYGALVANLCFRSWTRRILFMAAAIIIPILANGVRAWGTMIIAHHWGEEFALSADHVIAGWFFFALVMVLIMAAGWRFFDRGIHERWFDPEKLQPAGTLPGPAPRAWRTAAAALLIALVPSLWMGGVAAAGTEQPAAAVPFPEVPGWQRVAREGGRPWQPHFSGADLLETARYRDATGRDVDLSIAVFAGQGEGRELVSYTQGAVTPEGAWAWISDAPAPGGGRAERIASHGTVREVLTFYRVGNTLTGSRAAAKLETMKVRLLGGPQRAVAVLVSAEAPPGDSARPALDAFLSSLGAVAPLADAASGLPERR